MMMMPRIWMPLIQETTQIMKQKRHQPAGGRGFGGGRGRGGGASCAGGMNGVGRGRLPNPETDAKFVEGVRLYGRDWSLIATHMGNRTAAGVKSYWDRHKERLGLDALAGEPSGASGSWADGTFGGNINVASGSFSRLPKVASMESLLDLSLWQPLLAAVKALDGAAAGEDDDVPGKAQQQPELPASIHVFEDNKEIETIDAERTEEVAAPAAIKNLTETTTKVHIDFMSLLSEIPQTERERAISMLQPGGALLQELNDPFLGTVLTHLLNLRQVHAPPPPPPPPPGQEHELPIVAPQNTGAGGNNKLPGRRGKHSFWSAEEKDALLETYRLYGRDFDQLQAAVPSKTPTQVRNFYQNYKAKLFDPIQLAPGAVLPGSRKRKNDKLEEESLAAGGAVVGASSVLPVKLDAKAKPRKRGRPPLSSFSPTSAAVRAGAASEVEEEERKAATLDSVVVGIQHRGLPVGSEGLPSKVLLEDVDQDEEAEDVDVGVSMSPTALQAAKAAAAAAAAISATAKPVPIFSPERPPLDIPREAEDTEKCDVQMEDAGEAIAAFIPHPTTTTTTTAVDDGTTAVQ
ncbi:hypothetical protein Ndes2437A_g01282 [Nannochloris sp. 'desiccata']